MNAIRELGEVGNCMIHETYLREGKRIEKKGEWNIIVYQCRHVRHSAYWKLFVFPYPSKETKTFKPCEWSNKGSPTKNLLEGIGELSMAYTMSSFRIASTRRPSTWSMNLIIASPAFPLDKNGEKINGGWVGNKSSQFSSWLAFKKLKKHNKVEYVVMCCILFLDGQEAVNINPYLKIKHSWDIDGMYLL